MNEELLEEPTILDCLIETHELKETSKLLSDGQLIDFIMSFSEIFTLDNRTFDSIKSYYNKGKMIDKDRQILENSYVIIRSFICWGENEEDSGICMIRLIE